MNVRNRLHPNMFARLWNESETLSQESRMTGMKPRSASMRAAEYRKRYGIPLQKFGEKGPEVDWNDVRRIAEEATRRRLLGVSARGRGR